MIKKSIIVCGHPRSGNHYLASVINKNYFNKKDYTFLLGSHNVPRSLNRNIKYLYIMRNFDDVAKSVFKIKKRFGLSVDDFDIFLTKKYSEMFDKFIDSSIIFKKNHREKEVSGISDFFGKFDMTPEEFYKWHIGKWESIKSKNKNVLLIRYESLIGDFEQSMVRINKFLGFPNKSFLNIKEKVGWYNKLE